MPRWMIPPVRHCQNGELAMPSIPTGKEGFDCTHLGIYQAKWRTTPVLPNYVGVAPGTCSGH